MSEEKNIFDKKFVYLEWDGALKGKQVLASDNLQCMRRDINDGTAKLRCVEDNSSRDKLYPFKDDRGTLWALVYYDPLYEVKLAWKNGKQIQSRSKVYMDPEWIDDDYPDWNNSCEEHRVKPEEKKWRPFKDIVELKNTFLSMCYPKGAEVLKNKFIEPLIWVRDKKRPDITRLITGFNGGSKCVALAGQWHILEGLFEDYMFLDGSPCGVEE